MQLVSKMPVSAGAQIPLLLRMGFVALLIFACVWPRYFFLSVGGVGVNPYTLGVLAASAVGLIWLLVSARTAGLWLAAMRRSAGLVFLLLVYTIWRFISASTGIDSTYSTALWVRESLYLTLIFVPASIFFLDQRCVSRVPKVILLCVIFSGTIGLYERALGFTFVGQIGIINFAAGDMNQLTSIISPKFREGVVRAQSLFSHPIVFGQFIAAFLPFALVCLRSSSRSTRMLATIVLLLSPFAVLASAARSPIVVALAAVAAWYLLNSLSIRNLGVQNIVTRAFGLGLIVVLLLFSADFVSSLVAGRTETEIGSSAARDEMLLRGIYAIADRPVFGYGLGQAAAIAGLTGAGGIQTIDNLYLSEGIDSGVVGLVLLLALLVLVTTSGFALARKLPVGTERSVVICMTAMVVAVAVGQSILSITDNLAFVYLAAGLFVAVNGRIAPGGMDEHSVAWKEN